MRKVFSILACSAIVFIGFWGRVAGASDIGPKDLEGCWIVKGYIDSVLKDRSPHKAGRNNEELYFEVKKDNNLFQMDTSTFHEGWSQVIMKIEPIKKTNSYRMVVSAPEAPFNPKAPEYHTFRVKRNNRGTIETLVGTFGGEKENTFVRIPGEIASYLNKIVLAGTYKDHQGKLYVFTDRGEAIWPDGNFEYSIVPDRSEAEGDYFNVTKVKQGKFQERYGYEWRGKKLYIFNIVDTTYEKDGAPIGRGKKPLLILQT